MATTTDITRNGQTFAQASSGITDRGQLGALAQQYQAPEVVKTPTNTGTSTNTPIGSVFNDTYANNTSSDRNYQNAQNILTTQMNGGDVVDTNRIRSDTIAQFQDRINALNQIYDQQLQQSQLQGKGRTGSGTAVLAARGLAGSGRGAAIQEGITQQNNAADAAVQAERSSAIQQVLGLANQQATEEAARRREAVVGGAKEYINFIKTQGERKQSDLNDLSGSLIAQGFDPSTMSAQELKDLATSRGVSTNDIIGAYKQAKFTYDQEQQAASAKAKQDGQFNLSEGQARYDSTGKLIASRGKTYAPKSPTTGKPLTVAQKKAAIEKTLKTGNAPSGDKLGNGRGTDGYTDPYVYLQAFNNWDGTVKDFVNYFPIKSNVNPASYNLLPEAIRPKASSSSTSSREI